MDKITISPDSVAINSAVTLTISTTLYTTANSANANIYLLTPNEFDSIQGTNVEALSKTPLSCAKTSNAPVIYSCSATTPSAQGTYYIYI